MWLSEIGFLIIGGKFSLILMGFKLMYISTMEVKLKKSKVR